MALDLPQLLIVCRLLQWEILFSACFQMYGELWALFPTFMANYLIIQHQVGSTTIFHQSLSVFLPELSGVVKPILA